MFTVTMTTDRMGRGVALVPDEIARLLSSHQDEGWREVADVGWGCSRTFPAEHPVTVAAAAIDAVREDAGDLHAMVVGVGDWDPVARGWVDYLGRRDLHPRAFDVQHGTARFSG